MVPRDIVNKVIEDTDIVEVINEYVPLTPKGSSMFGLCPFHEDKNPSMSVSKEKKIYKCFSCNAKGNVITFVSQYENIPFDEATVKLAKRLGMDVSLNRNPEDIKKERLFQAMKHANEFYQFYLRNSEVGQAALNYLHKRGLSDEIIKKFQIGLSGKDDYLHQALNEKKVDPLDQVELGLVRQRENGTFYDVFRSRIMFPLNDLDGRVVGFSGRIFLPNDKNAKYINSQETSLFHKSRILYNYHEASIHIKRLDKIFVFEGFMDVIAAEIAGISNTVATMGTALTKDHIKALLSLTKNIVFCFDGDQAGILATKRAAELFGSSRTIPQAVCLPNGLDPDEYLKKYGNKALIDYLNDKAVNIYEYLYQNALKDLVSDDLTSIERFKTEMFQILKRVRSQTIRDFLLKKMAEALHVPLENLSLDLGKQKEESQSIAPKTVKKKKDFEVPTLGVIRSFNSIIRYALHSRDKYSTYLNRIEKLTLPKGILEYHQILGMIGKYYSIMDSFQEEKFMKMFKDDPKLINAYKMAKEEEEKLSSYKIDEEEDFINCLTTIEKFIIRHRMLNNKGGDGREVVLDAKKIKKIEKMEE